MVLTLEPGVALPDGKIMVHEEDILITETGAEYLSSAQSKEIRTL
jgi:Xaa-Pro aminopeptidase